MSLPPPGDLTAAPRDLVHDLAGLLGGAEVVRRCVELLDGGDPRPELDLLPHLAGRPGVAYPAGGWPPYWPRVWAARALLYVWDDSAAPAVLAGLGDDSWRVVEMCLKVSALRELPAGDRGVAATAHELSRVRSAALRALGAGGDVEHVPAVRAGLDDPDEQVRRSAARALDRMRERLDLG
ncbi:HEAT repeat domain-containing protein [Nocardioides mesophilus]|uniref:HEAT repeat domain-containing protein n=1 Tax=Nocardioides mesophilus TaxID=433659 RepID=A0A7G9RE11_9ACTN|nr:HEAT repeat domain-containing protein [Nocardioides mesophilus]QNN53836.1 HEAT repeat domain-containing protein [Nocardioides mesophilus]